MSYEVPSLEEKTSEMLGNISESYDKQVGGLTYELTKTYAVESKGIREDIAVLFSKLDMSNFEGEELEKQTSQKKGISRKTATYAKGVVEVTGNGTVSIGDLFETESGVQFEAIEEVAVVDSASVNVVCVIAGSAGNVAAGYIVYIPITIQGITEVTNSSAMSGGYDKETDESLLERYYLEIQKPATSGNVYHYIQWAREVAGVGDARISPLWNGNNTVKIIVIDDNKENAPSSLVNEVQVYIDPKGTSDSTWGAGYGEAPIGAYCTVVSASALDVNVNATLVLEAGYNIEDVQEGIESEIKAYLKEIAFVRNYISFAILSSRVLEVEGVSDWSSFLINGAATNININDSSVAVSGTVALNV